MTAQHFGMVFDCEGLDGPEKLLLAAYCNRTDDHGYCWPGVQRLADDCGTSVATVKRVKARLVAKGLIKVENRRYVVGSKPITDLTRVNVAKLASMKRAPRDYGDNVIERITFDESDEQVDKGRAQDEPSGHPNGRGGWAQDEPRSGLILSPCWAQDEPLTLNEPSPETSTDLSVADGVAQGAGGLGAASGGGSAASEKTDASETSDQGPSSGKRKSPRQQTVKTRPEVPVKGEDYVFGALDALGVLSSPAARIPTLRKAVRAFLRAGRTPEHGVSRVNTFWYARGAAERFADGEIRRPVGYLAAFFNQECSDPGCELGVLLDSGRECSACGIRAEERAAEAARMKLLEQWSEQEAMRCGGDRE